MSTFVDAHLADLLFADRRWRDSFAAGIAAVNCRRHKKAARTDCLLSGKKPFKADFPT
jgi:hypothetical protein